MKKKRFKLNTLTNEADLLLSAAPTLLQRISNSCICHLDAAYCTQPQHAEKCRTNARIIQTPFA